MIPVNQSDAYIRERCVLDVYHPTNIKEFPDRRLVSWRRINRRKKFQLPALVERILCGGGKLSFISKVKSPKYIEDAAAAVAWVLII
jgi:hypothetical protein